VSTSHREHLDRVLSIAVGVAAICAVAIAVYQAKIMREQQRASAWPYIVQSNSFGERTPYLRQMHNAGVGPARVRWFEVLVDGKPLSHWADVVRAMTGESEPGLIYSSFRRGHVMLPGVSETILQLPPGPRALKFWSAAQTRLATIVCYCSVYDECWRADDREDEPVAVSNCNTVPAGQFAE
jgi:hypothetical protein